jgi:hypothetical protein
VEIGDGGEGLKSDVLRAFQSNLDVVKRLTSSHQFQRGHAQNLIGILEKKNRKLEEAVSQAGKREEAARDEFTNLIKS